MESLGWHVFFFLGCTVFPHPSFFLHEDNIGRACLRFKYAVKLLDLMVYLGLLFWWETVRSLLIVAWSPVLLLC